MTAPLHTRPFNLEHARAGAPFCCRNGDQVEILKWDRKHTQCIIGLSVQDAAVRHWRADGSYSATVGDINTPLSLAMIPLGMIDGKPVFVGDEYEVLYGDNWMKTQANAMSFAGKDVTSRRWPAPKPVYPETLMTALELAQAGKASVTTSVSERYELEARSIANAAIRRAIEDRQVMETPKIEKAVEALTELANDAVSKLEKTDRALGKAERLLESLGFSSAGDDWLLAGEKVFFPEMGGFHIQGNPESMEKVKQLLVGRQARDMAVAQAVRDAAYVAVMNCGAGHEGTVTRQIDLAAVIAGVKA